MEITLTVNGKPVKATVDEKEMRDAMGEKQEKRTGYECFHDGYIVTEEGEIADVCFESDEKCEDSDEYQTANFYTDKKVAENNARADSLMRKLRRFAAEHGGCVSGRYHTIKDTWTIILLPTERLSAAKVVHDNYKEFGEIAFSTEQAANEAIGKFCKDLLWYFTEYDPMPEGWWDD